MDVKICGVCDASDARMAADAGATHIGVILAPGRTRSQTVGEAAVIFGAAAARRVGVFVDAPAAVVIEAARELELDAVQLHGDEAPAIVQRIRDGVTCDVWKALHVRTGDDFASGVRAWRGAVDAVLLDGWSAGAKGGTGARFDWQVVADAGGVTDLRLIVAGGLTPDNVAAAVSLLNPAMVDVSSGVESAPCRKSPGKVHAFIAAARGARMMQ